ncbi:MAG: hypothetical protein AAFX06_12795 [Planctomycetota bacterium]
MKSMKYAALGICVVVLCSSSFVLRAQDDATSLERQFKDVPGVPAGALQTERGRELAIELKNLYRSKQSMGPRHPSLPTVEKRIEAVKSLLKAFAPAENPFKGKDNSDADPNMMNDYDLRQLVLKLNKRVEQLEKRVEELEGKR